MTPEHVQSVLSSEIYTRLFGMSRAELLAIAKTMPCFDSTWAKDNDDEAMRDCFSIEALQALSTVEERATERLLLFTFRGQSTEEIASILANIVLGACKDVVKEPMNPFEETKGE